MKKLLYIFVFLPMLVFSQEDENKVSLEEKNLVRDGNELFNQNSFVDAEVKYKKAIAKNQNYEKANYNLGNAIYEQNRFEEALPNYELVTKTSKDKSIKAASHHNIGNIFMQAKDYTKAVEAFKNSLRANPTDEETRYNLALAKKLLEDQQNQDDQNKDDKKQDKDKDKKDQDKNQDQQQDENQDQQDQNQDQNKDNQDQNQDQQNKNQDDQKQQQQKKPNQLSKEQMEQLLEAMNKEENKTQKKVNAKKAKGSKIKQEKDW